MNILDLLKSDGFKPKLKARTWGDTYSSPCPSCGGDDRFRSFPNNEGGLDWLCQKCGKRGNLIQYLTEFRGIPYEEACQQLNISPSRRKSFLLNDNLPRAKNEWNPATASTMPSEKWQLKARQIIKTAERDLWSKSLLKNTHSWIKKRGLNKKTLKDSNIGFTVNLDRYEIRSEWGLSERLNEQGEPTKLWIPSGLVIPYEKDGQIKKIKIRNFDENIDQKYILLEGSSTGPMVWGENKYCFVIVESELDGLLLHQEAGDMVGVIALGSAQMRPDVETTGLLRKSSGILIALDHDDAGTQNSKWWTSQFPNAIRWPVIKGKDPSEAFQHGLDLRMWVFAGLQIIQRDRKTVDQQPIEISTLSEENDIPPFDHIMVKDPELLKKYLTPFYDSDVLAIQVDPSKDEIHLGIPDNPVLIIDTKEITDLDPLKEFIEGHGEKILHDAKSTIKSLSHNGIHLQDPFFDLILASQLLDAGLSRKDYELENLSRKYPPVSG